MGEAGLSPAEVGKEIAEHQHRRPSTARRRHRTGGSPSSRPCCSPSSRCSPRGPATPRPSGAPSRRSRWPGPRRLGPRPTAPTSTPSRPRNFDSSTFNAWFTAYTAGDEQAHGAGREAVPPGVRRGVPGLARHRSRRTTPMRPRARPTCPSTSSPSRTRPTELDDEGRRALRRGRQGRHHGRRLRPHDGVPGQRAVPRRHQRPLPGAGGALRPGGGGGRHPGGRRLPVDRRRPSRRAD